MLRDELREHLTHKILPFWEGLKDAEHGGFYGYMDNHLILNREADEEGLQNMRILARNMTFLMRGIALAREKYGMPEQEKITFTNFVR